MLGIIDNISTYGVEKSNKCLQVMKNELIKL